MLKPYHKAELTFDIIREIGQDGKNSHTFIAHDHQLNADIVAKRLLKASLNSPDEFFAESKALYASAHPNVVQVHYACFDDDHVYVAMPYYSAGSMKDLMAARHLTVREIIAMGCQVLAGLHNIHSKSLIHFDIKPDNILLSARGEALISDFGQAKQMNFSGIAAQDRLYGKMIPPEATRTDHFDRRFDIYQVGLTLYRMANGNAHFYDQFAKYGPPNNFDRGAFQFDVRNGRFPDRSSFLPHIPSTLRNVVRRCLEVDPASRYGSAVDVANAIAGIDGPCLDWQLQLQGNSRVWTKTIDGTKLEVVVNADGSCEGYKATDSGTRRRVRDLCKNSINDKELKKLFMDI